MHMGHPMSTPVLYTIGYQASTVADFLRTLSEAGVQLLIDVRRVASSRRPGFAKTALKANLDSAGIEYRHLRSVGTPADGRAAARAGNHAGMKKIFLEHLQSAEAVEGLRELRDLLEGPMTVCIMCFEHDPMHCHRSLVATALQDTMPLQVVHLIPDVRDPELR